MVRKKTDEISGAETLKSNTGNTLQGKPSLGFSIQIKLGSYSLNATSSWQLEALPSICALVSFQSQAEPDCHTEQVFADNTCTSSGGSQFSSFQTLQIESRLFSVNSLLPSAHRPGHTHNTPAHPATEIQLTFDHSYILLVTMFTKVCIC